MKHILSIVILFFLLFQGLFAANSVMTNVGYIKYGSGYTGTIPGGGETKGFIGQVLSDIFYSSGMIKNEFISAFQTIGGFFVDNIPRWDGNKFVKGSMYDVGGNIGVGTGTISSGLRLDVEGKVGATEYCDENGNNCETILDLANLWIENGANVYRGGKVGIGVLSPVTGLHVSSIGRFDGGVQVDGRRAISNTNRSHTAQSNLGDYGFFQVKNNAGDTGAYFGAGNGGNRVNFVLDTADRLNIKGGNVGIGIDNPSNKLEVAGKIEADEYCDRNGSNCIIPGMGGITLGSPILPGGYPTTTTCGIRTLTTNGTPQNIGGVWGLRYSWSGNTCTNEAYSRTYDGTTWSSCSYSSNEQCSCYIAGTQVTMANGTEKNIEDVKIGEKVLGGDGNPNIVLGYDRPQLGSRLLYSFNGGPYFVTAEHPFKTMDGWKSINVNAFIAENPALVKELQVTTLQVGDEIIMSDGTMTLITSIESQGAPNQTLYNFELDGDNIYFADGFMTHNKPGD